MRLLHISDVHLGAPLGGFGTAAADRRRAIRDAFRRLPARADALRVDAVLVAGDLFDGPRPDAADLDVAREVLRGLSAGGRPVFAIPGNHDPATGRDSPWHAMPETVTTILAPRFGPPISVSIGPEGEALHVYGIAFDPSVEAEPLSGYRRAEAEGMHVVLLHAGTSDHPEWTGGSGLRVTTADLAGLDADYVALGDHHQFRPPSDFRGAPACYAGSFAAVAVDETGPRGCAVVALEPGAPPRVTLDAAGVPRLEDMDAIDVSDAVDELEVADRVGARLDARLEAHGAAGWDDVPASGSPEAHPVVTLAGEPGFPLDVERVRDALCERFGFAVVRDRTRFIDSEHVRSLAARPTVAGHVARLGLERIGEASTDAARATAERALRLALGALEAETGP